jgi:hypothetical protein
MGRDISRCGSHGKVFISGAQRKARTARAPPLLAASRGSDAARCDCSWSASTVVLGAERWSRSPLQSLRADARRGGPNGAAAFKTACKEKKKVVVVKKKRVAAAVEGGIYIDSGGEEETIEMQARQVKVQVQRLRHGLLLLPARQVEAPLQRLRHGLLPARQGEAPRQRLRHG